jgi:hypothetical protein
MLAHSRRGLARVMVCLSIRRSLPNTCENYFNRPVLLLWPKGSLIIGVENEGRTVKKIRTVEKTVSCPSPAQPRRASLATIFWGNNCDSAGVEDEWIGHAFWPSRLKPQQDRSQNRGRSTWKDAVLFRGLRGRIAEYRQNAFSSQSTVGDTCDLEVAEPAKVI